MDVGDIFDIGEVEMRHVAKPSQGSIAAANEERFCVTNFTSPGPGCN